MVDDVVVRISLKSPYLLICIPVYDEYPPPGRSQLPCEPFLLHSLHCESATINNPTPIIAMIFIASRRVPSFVLSYSSSEAVLVGLVLWQPTVLNQSF